MPEASPLGFPHKRERVTDKNQVPLYEGGTGGGAGEGRKGEGETEGGRKGPPVPPPYIISIALLKFILFMQVTVQQSNKT